MLPELHTKRGIWLKQKGRNMAGYKDSHNPLSPLVWGQAGEGKGDTGRPQAWGGTAGWATAHLSRVMGWSKRIGI